mgnify:CR=1 FL=1
MLELTLHTDPAHGWVEVPLELIINLGLSAKISSYSYRKGFNAYLEEDCDAGLLIKALKDAGKKIEVVEYHTNRNSKIRSYSHFVA